MLAHLKRYIDNQYERDAFILAELARLPAGALLLDAGAGSQRYRKHCAHLRYRAQDFGGYQSDAKPGFADCSGGSAGYGYGPLDYSGNIWRIEERDAMFDAVLCAEVIEHVPYPIETIRELARLLKPGGTLILTAPSNSLRHMDPYFFYAGFSDRFYEKILPEQGLEIEALKPVGDYYKWLLVELARTGHTHSLIAKLMLAPAFLWYLLKRPSERSVNTLCIGYHIRARKK